MRIARVRQQGSDTVHLARVEEPDVVLLCDEAAHPAADVLRESLWCGLDLGGSGKRVSLDDVDLLSPVANPSKVIGIGLNYADHARESGAEIPTTPPIFIKTTNSIIGPGSTIEWDKAITDQVDYEAELAVIIGRDAWHVRSDPLSYVLGYTCCNDVSARDLQFSDGQWVRGKSLDTFCPLGPWITTTDDVEDPQRLNIGCDLDGERMQYSTTAQMIFGVADLITFISSQIRLVAGDVIATGTPVGVGFARTPPRYLASGDEVTVWVEGIGTLTNICKST